MRVAKLKKLSALRKKPSIGLIEVRLSLKQRVSGDEYSPIAMVVFLVPPSMLKPSFSAMASSKVDLPEPFSPTKRLKNHVRARFKAPRSMPRPPTTNNSGNQME